MTLNCYVDADFAGLWNYEDDQDPVCVRSRTGYVMTMVGCPLHWTSKLQTELALSTTEAEYIALAQAMREFIPMRRAFDDMLAAFRLDKDQHHAAKSTIFEDNNAGLSPQPPLQECLHILNILLLNIILLNNYSIPIIKIHLHLHLSR